MTYIVDDDGFRTWISPEDYVPMLENRIAALEAELNAAQAAHTKSHEEAADWRRMHGELLTELGPWRRMCEQLEALGKHYTMIQAEHDPDEKYWEVEARNLGSFGATGYGDTLPAAVADAYGKVVGE